MRSRCCGSSGVADFAWYGLPVDKNLEDKPQQVVRYRHHRRCPLASVFGGNTPELVPQKAVLLFGGPLGALRQGAPQPGVAFVRVAALALARAPVVARTHSSPPTDMPFIAKLRHIRSGFRQDGG